MIVAAALTEDTDDVLIEASGPEWLTWRQIADIIGEKTGRRIRIIPLPAWLARLDQALAAPFSKPAANIFALMGFVAAYHRGYLEDAFPEPSLRPDDPATLARARLFLRLPDLYFQGAPRTLLSMRDPAARKQEVVDEAFGHLHRTLAAIDHYLDGGPWAVGGRASIADSALIPVLNVVTLVGRVYQQADLFTRHPKIAAYWEAARTEPVHARVIGEQMAAVPQ